jgi:hypothetical protein
MITDKSAQTGIHISRWHFNRFGMVSGKICRENRQAALNLSDRRQFCVETAVI